MRSALFGGMTFNLPTKKFVALIGWQFVLTMTACGGGSDDSDVWPPVPETPYDSIPVRVLNGIGSSVSLEAKAYVNHMKPGARVSTMGPADFSPGDSQTRTLPLDGAFSSFSGVEFEVTVRDGAQVYKFKDLGSHSSTLEDGALAVIICPVIVSRRGVSDSLLRTRSPGGGQQPGPRESNFAVINCTLNSDHIDISLGTPNSGSRTAQHIKRVANSTLSNLGTLLAPGRYQVFANDRGLREIELAAGKYTTLIITDYEGRLDSFVWTGSPGSRENTATAK